MKNLILSRIQESIAVKQLLLSDSEFLTSLELVVEKSINTFQTKGKMLFCGNGGSAADAQHIAAELSGRFLLDRDPLFAEALHVNSSYLTAVANDYSFDHVYARMIKAMGNRGDILVCISTSGQSKNIIKAAIEAKNQGLWTIALTGKSGGGLAEITDVAIKVPSTDTARIQECHIMIGHILCELVEQKIFGIGQD
ncbi:D-sedoheptulose-7-phosphate isomerase [Membranihabitans marinus]|uniref:D-sedoheptulose-7-phosphate isomerase n=1 Tax=Membranihabitans marinus TaxID=1227546 RepID=UPI001F02C0E2|nr:SIS domain-containing protein [Membranihabitans marinus]